MSSQQPLSIQWRDYLELTKPKVVLMMLITAVVGMLLTTRGMPPWINMIAGLLGIGCAAGSAATVNHLLDRRIDAQMARTTKRPLPQKKITQGQAVILAILLAVNAVVILSVWTNLLTTLLTLFALVGYAFVYTVYLKRATPQNIVIGGLSGAMPPLLGWCAITGQIDPQALVLVLIIFLWTPPHFWALAIYRADDYAKAEVPMLPVTHGVKYTKLNIVCYTVLLSLITMLPFLIGMSHWCYLVGVIVLNGLFLMYAVRLYFSDERVLAIKTFGFSNIYLLSLFVLLLIDHYWKPL